jgi:flavin reductase (DIM6/NTAB) family NADH-FMN oxidoreductase RutF
MEIDPNSINVAQRYRLMIGSIVPRPIAVVSTVSPDGRPNLAPFSFFNGVGAEPMTLLFCPANTADGSEKDTLRNCKPKDEGGTGEFVINLALEEYAREVAAAAEPLPYGDSEFDLTGMEKAAGRVVRAPRLAASPVAFECRTRQVIRLAPGVPSGANLVLGEVVHIFIRDDLVDEGLHVLPEVVHAIGRLGGLGYCTVRDRFELPRGRAALDSDEVSGDGST